MSIKVLARLLEFFLPCLITAFLVGCVTTVPIQKLPTAPEAFRVPPDKLRAEYPEITEYEKMFRGFILNTPYSKQLITAWGEPDQKKTDWGYPVSMGATLVGCGFLFGPAPALITAGVVIAIRPYSFEYFYWRKDDYCIEAKIDHAIMGAYKESLAIWKWHYMKDGKEIPAECGKQETTSIITETSK